MARDITISAPDEVVVKAVSGLGAAAGSTAAPAAAPQRAEGPSNITILSGEQVSDEVSARVTARVRSLEKALLDSVAQITAQKQAGTEEAELIFPPLLWNLATYGPIQLGPPAGNSPFDVNKVIQTGQLAAMIGISYGAPYTAPPSNMYLAGKLQRARFTSVRLTGAVGAGPAMAFPVTPFTVAPFHFYVWLFTPIVTPGSEGDLYDVNFDIDISTPFVPGGGFANFHFDPDSAIGIPIGVPGTGPQWRNAISGRFMVNNFPG